MLADLLSRFYRFRVETSGEQYMLWRRLIWQILVEDFFNRYIKRSDTVMDLPSGFGEFINTVKCKVKIASDINPDCKKYLKPGIKFVCCPSVKIKMSKDSVDKIFCSNFFEHITHQDILKTIKEFRRILKNNGKVLVFQPNVRFLTKDFWRFFDHITPIDDRGLEDAFGLLGFRLVYKIEKFFPFTVKDRLPKSALLVRIYLRIPILWLFFGQQSFLIFEKTPAKLSVSSPTTGPVW